MNIDDTLKDRNSTHGDFGENAQISQRIKSAMFGHITELSDVHREALEMIALKISRICSGYANEPDHWKDIQGYARLAENEAIHSQGDEYDSSSGMM